MRFILVGLVFTSVLLTATAENAQLVCSGKAWIWNNDGNNEHAVKGIHIDIGAEEIWISGNAMFAGRYAVSSSDVAEVRFANDLKLGSINRFSGELNLSAYATNTRDRLSNAINAVCEKPNPLF